jgi:hypothetical protein
MLIMFEFCALSNRCNSSLIQLNKGCYHQECLAKKEHISPTTYSIDSEILGGSCRTSCMGQS